MKHAPEIPDAIWKWAQRKSGKTNPSSWIREVLWTAMIADINGTAEPVKVETKVEDPWREVGLDLQPPLDGPDSNFHKAREAFVCQFGGEAKTIRWFRDAGARGIHSPRAFLMNWWNDQKPQAI